jgi:membrane fusion protein, multidrug efflux system
MPEQKEEKNEEDNGARGKKSGRRFWIIGGLVLFFILAGLGYGCYWCSFATFYVGTDDAYVGGNQISVSSQINGIVAAVLVDGCR